MPRALRLLTVAAAVLLAEASQRRVAGAARQELGKHQTRTGAPGEERVDGSDGKFLQPAQKKKKLPYGWRAAKDPESGKTYFWRTDNPKRTRQWDEPSESQAMKKPKKRKKTTTTTTTTTTGPPPPWKKASDVAWDAAINATKAADEALLAEKAAMATLNRKGREANSVMQRLKLLSHGHDIIYWTQRTIWRNQQTMHRVNRLRPLRNLLPTDPPPTPDPVASVVVCSNGTDGEWHCPNSTNATNGTIGTSAAVEGGVGEVEDSEEDTEEEYSEEDTG